MTNDERLAIIEKSSKQVSRGIFFSTIIIVASFLPVFLLTGQEGKLFHPLAYTKTFILLIDAVLAVTLAPVLLSFFMKGKFKTEEQNPINRGRTAVRAAYQLVPDVAQNHHRHQPGAAGREHSAAAEPGHRVYAAAR